MLGDSAVIPVYMKKSGEWDSGVQKGAACLTVRRLFALPHLWWQPCLGQLSQGHARGSDTILSSATTFGLPFTHLHTRQEALECCQSSDDACLH